VERLVIAKQGGERVAVGARRRLFSSFDQSRTAAFKVFFTGLSVRIRSNYSPIRGMNADG
jgi:hypothetical protein